MEPGFDLSNPDKMAHGLHMHVHADNEQDRKANLWACIAAYAHTVSYDYQRVLHFIEWANAYQLLAFHSSDWTALPQPDAIEYLDILEFRCGSLEGARKVPNKEWDWPKGWGHVHWNCPVTYSAPRVFDEPSWASPRLDQAIADTAEAILLHKRQLGHRAPITFSATERILVSEMQNLFMGVPDFAEIPSLPSVHLSLDQPPLLTSKNTEEGRFDTDELLGQYYPGRRCEVVIYERGLRYCSERLKLPKLALREIVIAHELAHWLSDQIPLRPCTSISNHERWSNPRYETSSGSTTCHPSRFDQTEKDVHESWAQALTFYTLLLTYEDRLRNSTAHPSLRDYVKRDGRGCLYAFLELNERQSATYRVWRDIVALGRTPREVACTLPALRVAEPGATVALWRNLLQT